MSTIPVQMQVRFVIFLIYVSFLFTYFIYNKLVIGWLFAQLTINWDSLFLNFKLASSFGLGQFLFRNNPTQLTVNCTHNHPITITNLQSSPRGRKIFTNATIKKMFIPIYLSLSLYIHMDLLFF